MSGKAIIAKIELTEEIPGANNIQIGYVYGEQVIISKDTPVGYVGIYFPAETQLSEDYCSWNNLYRRSHLNRDKEQKGFFEENRKVRAQKFMGVKSEGYFAPLESLSYIKGYDKAGLKLGDQVDTIEGVSICCKFISEFTKQAANSKKSTPSKPVAPMFHQHVDTEQFRYFLDRIPEGATLSFHHKMHGTSARYSNTLVVRQPTGWKKKVNQLVSKLFGPEVKLFKPTQDYEYVVGTRRVVLLEEQVGKEGFHGSEQFRYDWLEKLKPHLDKGVTVYGEIVGYANGKPIMHPHSTAPLKSKQYTAKYGETMVYKYGCPEGTNRFIVYRVSYTTPDGKEIDLSLDQMYHWCRVRGLEHTTELCARIYKYPKESRDTLSTLVNFLTENEKAGLTEDYCDPSHVNEGVVVRCDFYNMIPHFYKHKSFAFKVMEGIANETTVDTEDAA